jgi:hypothetical protein
VKKLKDIKYFVIGYMFHFLSFSKTRVVEFWDLIVLMINVRSELVTIEENMFVCFFSRNIPIVMKFSILHLLLSLQEMWKYFHTSMDQLEYCY